MDYLHESALSIYRRRRRRRSIVAMIAVAMVLTWSIFYASSYVQRWVSNATPTSVTNASCNESTVIQPLKPGDVTVNVYNSTPRTGLAGTVARSLQKQGFTVASTDNDPLGKLLPTVGEIRHGATGSEGAVLVAARLPGAKVVLDDRTDATVDLVVGKKFRGVKAPPKVVPAKKQTTPGC